MSPHNENKQIYRASAWHDYYMPGYYMLTIVTTNRLRQLGTIEGTSEEDAHTTLSPLGQYLDTYIKTLNHDFPEIEVITYTILPDHLHLLLQVHEQMTRHLGAIVTSIKTHTTREYLHQETRRTGQLSVTIQSDPREAWRQQNRLNNLQSWLHTTALTPTTTLTPLQQDALWVMQQQLDQPGTPATTCPTQGRPGRPESPLPIRHIDPLWQQGYHDRIVTKRGQIATLRHYIARNAARLWMKQHADRNLTQVHDLRIPIAFEQAIALKALAVWCDERRTVQTSQYSRATPDAATFCELLSICLRKSAGADEQPYLHCRACGNADLLGMGRPLIDLRLSRSITEQQFETAIRNVMKRCEEEEAIVVSPFLSWSEKEVLRLLRKHQYPHIMLRGEEMSMVWKASDSPSSNHHQQMPQWYRVSAMYRDLNAAEPTSDFDVSLSGQLLTLAPWPNRPRGQHMCKFDMELMNKMAWALAQTYWGGVASGW